MQIEIFTICDNAQSYNHEKLVIVGTFNQIASSEFPVVYPLFSVVARILYDKAEFGKKQFELTITNPDGMNAIQPFRLDAIINSDLEYSYININLNVCQMLLEKPGMYNVRLVSEGINRIVKLDVRKI